MNRPGEYIHRQVVTTDLSEQLKGNVVLFPQSIDFYQIELTRMLETDRFAEAAAMLRFLLQCENGDPRADEEWRALLDWLETTFPQMTDIATDDLLRAAGSPSEDGSDAEEEQSETDMMRKHLNDKAEADKGFVERLVDKLQPPEASAEQLLVVEQLALIREGDRSIDEKLLRWLHAVRLSPIDQFSALQALGKRGLAAVIELEKLGERIRVMPTEVPQTMEAFPEGINRVIRTFQDVCGESDPVLAAFGEQTWFDFLAFLYGTAAYRKLAAESVENSDVWAAALHAGLLEAIHHASGGELDMLKSRYGISSESESKWREALDALRSFLPAGGA